MKLIPTLLGAFAALSLLCVPVQASHLQNGYFLNLMAMPLIECASADGMASGSGTYIGHGKVLTAAHVVHGRTCAADDHKASISYEDDALDLAVLTINEPFNNPIVPIDCAGVVKGHVYLAVGYSHGNDFAMQALIATGETKAFPSILDDEDDVDAKPTHPPMTLATFTGDVFSGMSGGPVLSASTSGAAVVGIVNMGNGDRDLGRSASRLLRDTPLCTALQSPVIAPAAPIKPSIAEVIGAHQPGPAPAGAVKP